MSQLHESLHSEGQSQSGSAVLDVQGLTKRYSGGVFKRNSIEALRGVDLKAGLGEVFGILGPNGAGKTTLIKVLLGVVKPTSGSAHLFGQSVGSVEARRRVGYLPESLRIDRHHTARSALAYYGRLSGMTAVAIAKRTDELLDLVGLAGRDRESVSRFSKGMYQRLGLAQALMHDPDLLILDEPTDGLDPVGRNGVRRVIETLREQGKTIFLNSHILQEVELVCSRVAILARGKIRGVGSVDELTRHLSSETYRINIESGHPFDHADNLQALAQQIGLDGDRLLCRKIAEGLFELHASLSERSQLDSLVDCLREKKHSIQHLEKQRPSLEDLFMKLVEDHGGRAE